MDNVTLFNKDVTYQQKRNEQKITYPNATYVNDVLKLHILERHMPRYMEIVALEN